jgi:hypothetical protein
VLQLQLNPHREVSPKCRRVHALGHSRKWCSLAYPPITPQGQENGKSMCLEAVVWRMVHARMVLEAINRQAPYKLLADIIPVQLPGSGKHPLQSRQLSRNPRP